MSDRFDCGECKESLYGRKYIQVEDVPHCIPCYDRLYANTCQKCKELIAHNARELFYEDRHYHEHCFRCFRCDRSLADEPFTSQEEALLCNDCYRNEFSSKCVACDKTVMPGSKKLEYGGSAWHEDCFVCHGCEKPIGGQSFIPDKDDYYCVPCYEGRFTPRCSRCKKGLARGSTFLSRIGSGTSPASSAPTALSLWLGPASSLTGTRSFAETATTTKKTNENHCLSPSTVPDQSQMYSYSYPVCNTQR
ncbi:four and a half LIM domains protein 3-like isoform X2 [Salvelinus namaycush]|uniref:Four and a half LIM domains protein 3-like isoform X2 n=1 Tax=Salvelinus namaycush TaxID=8040 RepID=A0A8U0TN05_SALNM|nr:four and a half LIM domains protein 3-like isoform X2 [Salvelinus namaycush]